MQETADTERPVLRTINVEKLAACMVTHCVIVSEDARPDLSAAGHARSQLSTCCRWFVAFLKRVLMITPEQGAWTTLFCCLADGVQGGTYYHSSLGIVPTSPLSHDEEKARQLWGSSMALAQDFKA